MKFPTPPRDGFPVAESFRQVLDYLRSITVVGIAGGQVQTTPNGTTLFPGKAEGGAYITNSGGRFLVSLSGNDLSVSVGTVFFGDGGKDKRSYYPIEPTLDGVILSENPSWDVTENPNDVLHKVWVVWSIYNYNARVELLPGDETPEYDTGENGLNIAEVTFSGEEDSRTMTRAQLWESDISGWRGGESDGSSDSGGGSSGGTGGSSEDSGIVESSLDASSESGSSESGSSGVPCPVINSVTVVPFAIAGVVGANCFEDNDEDGFPESTYVTVHCHVDIGAAPPGCRLYVRCAIGSAHASEYLGLNWSGGEKMVSVTFFAHPSSTYTVETTLFAAFGFSGCDLEGCEPFEVEYTTQPPCP